MCCHTAGRVFRENGFLWHHLKPGALPKQQPLLLGGHFGQPGPLDLHGSHLFDIALWWLAGGCFPWQVLNHSLEFTPVSVRDAAFPLCGQRQHQELSVWRRNGVPSAACRMFSCKWDRACQCDLRQSDVVLRACDLQWSGAGGHWGGSCEVKHHSIRGGSGNASVFRMGSGGSRGFVEKFREKQC